jgi:ABC-2 type transport system permease protein
MIFTIAILKEVKIMNSLLNHFHSVRDTFSRDSSAHPFWVIVKKEISDHVRSWRFVILIAIIALTCFGSLYTAITNMDKIAKPDDPEDAFFFLRLFTISDGTMPSYLVFISFLGPLLGISLGFDAINSEHNRGTLSRILSQPIHRDYILNAKFVGSLTVIGIMLFALGFLVMGIGLMAIGIPPTVEEFLRIVSFILLSIIYVAFWLNLSIFFSVRFRQPATSALSGIAVWLFFTIFYPMIINLISKMIEPSATASIQQIANYNKLITGLMGVLPNDLFSVASTTLLRPSIRSLGTLSTEQLYGAIAGPLPLSQSIILVRAQVTGLIAATVLCFILSYTAFMRKEIRSR